MECREPQVPRTVVDGLRERQPRPCEIDPHLRLRPRPKCDSRLDCDLQAFTLPEFTTSLRLMLLVLCVSAAALLTRRAYLSRRGLNHATVRGLAGLLLAGAAAEAYRETGHLLPGLAVGLGLLLLGGVIADATGPSIIVRALLSLPGAWVLATQTALEPLVPGWVRLLVGVVPVIGGSLMADLDRRGADLGLGPVLLAVTFVGLYETVPDTDLALVLLAVGLPLALLSWPVPLTSLGGGGCAVAAGLVAFVAAVGGRGRLSAVVGGVACLGLFVVEPLARLLLSRTEGFLGWVPRRPASTVVVGIAHLALVYPASRVAGLQSSVASATRISLLVLAAGTASAIVGANLLRSRDRPEGDLSPSDRARGRLLDQ